MDCFNPIVSFQTNNKTGFYNNIQETSDQLSDFEFSGGSPTSFTTAPLPPKRPLFLQNMEIANDYGCASLSLLQNRGSMEEMRETIFRMAMMQPVQMDGPAETLDDRPRRRNVRISSDPQSVAARRRRERISQRIRVLQRMVPGGAKLDTASMLDEAVHYMKFLKKQVQFLEEAANYSGDGGAVLYPLVGCSNMQMLS